MLDHTSRRTGLRKVAIAAVTGLALGTTAMLVPLSANADVSENLVVNPNFETSNAGWTAGPNTKFSTGSAHGGKKGIRLAPTNTQATVTLNDTRNTVQTTKAGHTYRATAWVKLAKPNVTTVVRMMEYTGSNVYKGQAIGSKWITNSVWTKLTVDYKAVTNGATLDLNVLSYQVPNTSYLDVDDISLVDLNAAATPAPTTTTTQPANGWKLAWSDEFAGSSLNTSKWAAEHYSTYGEGNKEVACLMNRKENLNVSNGTLKITARKESTPIKCGSADSRFPKGRSYSSAHITSRAPGQDGFLYGRYEIRAKMPVAYGKSKGLWPAFWMRPLDGKTGELDVLELVGSASGEKDTSNRVSQTIWYDYDGTYPKQGNSYTLPSGTFANGFHVFAVEWGPTYIHWYVDGKLTYSRTTATTSWLKTAFGNSNRPFYMRLNLAVGGTWPGTPNSQTAFPAEYEIDYVRVYQK